MIMLKVSKDINNKRKKNILLKCRTELGQIHKVKTINPKPLWSKWHSRTRETLTWNCLTWRSQTRWMRATNGHEWTRRNKEIVCLQNAAIRSWSLCTKWWWSVGCVKNLEFDIRLKGNISLYRRNISPFQAILWGSQRVLRLSDILKLDLQVFFNLLLTHGLSL